MSAVNRNPESFDLFVTRLRRSTYPDICGTVAAMPDVEPDDAADCHASLSCRLMLQPPIFASKECNRHIVSL